MFTRKQYIALLSLVLVAAAFRIAVVRAWPNDDQGDSAVYSQLARNILEYHVYSNETEAPFTPTYARVPGYPVFLASIYAVFGHTNNAAVRVVQALIDAGSCVIVALLAFYWQPNANRKRASAIAAMALASINPFTTAYAVAVLAEVPTIFLCLASSLAATLALATQDRKRAVLWSVLCGLLGAAATMFRPDSGLLVVVLGLVIVTTALVRAKKFSPHALGLTAAVVLSFVFVLTPWTIRNWRVFHAWQPLAPANATMPGGFYPYGYERWMKTWVGDTDYNENFWWGLNDRKIKVDDLPDQAFDSPAEHDRVAALFDQYNKAGSDNQAAEQDDERPALSPVPVPSPNNDNKKSAPTPKSSANANVNSNSEDSNDEQGDDEQDQTDDQDNQKDKPDSSAQGAGEMTPQIDAAFGQIAAERIARNRLRYYLFLPARRAHAMWFNVHSDLYPFDGSLFPLEDLDYTTHQHIWLPLFAAIVGIYTILGVAGWLVMLNSANLFARAWAIFLALMIVSRLVLLSTLVSPEPRYVILFFPFLAVTGGIAIVAAIAMRELWRAAVELE